MGKFYASCFKLKEISFNKFHTELIVRYLLRQEVF